MKDRVRQIRNMKDGKGIFTMDFQNDGEYVGGCIAGGRNYFHINAMVMQNLVYLYIIQVLIYVRIHCLKY